MKEQVLQAMELEDGTFQPPREDPGSHLDAPGASEGATAEGRIAGLFERMSAARGLLAGIVSFCDRPRTAEEVEGEVERLKRHEFSVFGAASLVEHLKRAGALEEVGGTCQPEPRLVEVDGVQYLEPAEGPEPSRLRSTPAGLAAIGAAASLGRFSAVLEEDARYEHVYRILLDCCSNEGGATAKAMGDAVDSDPELQEPRMFASYFFNRLAECGLVGWTGSAWETTGLGREAAALDARA